MITPSVGFGFGLPCCYRKAEPGHWKENGTQQIWFYGLNTTFLPNDSNSSNISRARINDMTREVENWSILEQASPSPKLSEFKWASNWFGHEAIP